MSDRRILGVAALLWGAFFASGCSTLAAYKINKKFPKISVLDKQIQSVEETQASLSALDTPNVYAFVSAQHMSDALHRAIAKPIKDNDGKYEVRLEHPVITTDLQDLRLESDFEARLLDPRDGHARVIVNGSFAAHAEPTVSSIGADSYAIGLRVAGENLHLSSVFAERELGWWWWFTKRKVALDLASSLVNWAMERINGQIVDKGKALAFAPMTLLPAHVKPSEGSPIDITDGNPVVLRLRVEPAATALDSTGLYVIGKAAINPPPPPGSNPPPPPPLQPLPPVVTSHLSKRQKRVLLEKQYLVMREELLQKANAFAAPLPMTTSAAISKAAIAEVVNKTLNDVDRCAIATDDFAPPNAEFEVPMPRLELHCRDLDAIDCSTDEHCFSYFRRIAEKNTDIDCERTHEVDKEDVKNAATCAAGYAPDCVKVTKRVVEAFTDAGCQALKTAAQTFVSTQTGIENLVKNIGGDAPRLYQEVCKADNFKDRLSCEAFKGVAGPLCEGFQQTLNNAWSLGQHIGDTGLIGWKVGDGDVGINLHAEAKGCIKHVLLANDLSRFSVVAAFGGKADVHDASLRWKPTAYGTAVTGCSEVTIHAKNFKVTLDETTHDLAGSLTPSTCLDPATNKIVPCLQLQAVAQTFKVKVDPEPIETIISQNWEDLGLRCSFPTVAGGPPLPFALPAAWVLQHYKDVKQLWGGDREFFWVERTYAPSMRSLRLHQNVKRWDGKQEAIDLEWRPNVLVAHVD